MSNSAHLLALTIGPVQDFIARARRTRDLWFGSFLLSEISKAAAREIDTSHKGALIFPSANGDAQAVSMLLRRRESNLALTPGVANVLLAQLPAGCDPKALAEAAKQAAQAEWELWANKAKAAARNAGLLANDKRWDDQVADAIEFYAAWVPFTEGQHDYATQRSRVMALLGGRKLLRDFKPAHGEAGVPKSSLDGMRESVLVKPEELPGKLAGDKGLAYRLRLSRNEQLDAIGFVKRAATKEAFASVTRVAVDSWLRGVEEAGKNGADLGPLASIDIRCRELMGRVPERDAASGNGGHYGGRGGFFPYDAQLLMKERVLAMVRQAEKVKRADEAKRASKPDGKLIDEEAALWMADDAPSLQAIQDPLSKLYQTFGTPDPYLAVLLADGDRMGEVLSACKTPAQHRALSATLNEFTKEARKIVKVHHGVCVFAGGEDVLAFAPIDRMLDCAHALQHRYGCLMGQACLDHGIRDVVTGAVLTPTLSVGLVIGHCLEPLEDLRNWAAGAEKAAKNKDGKAFGPPGHGLALHLYTRSGAPLALRGPWHEPDNLAQRLQLWVKLLNADALGDKAAFDLEHLARQYAKPDGDLAWNGPQAGAGATQALAAEAFRLIDRKKIDEAERPGVRKTLEAAIAANPVQPQHGALRLAHEWRVARLIANSVRQAEGKGRTA
ncbi:MAG: type III-B CRISPR-associated protein Cas10/Cmr2 [Rhodoferax sp.]|uniref:type III-B CRISPR-associated protein Cas10/Cmr2 n=1 Tax=Rhodoferax sp. TaxID=50421 RepID=UPI0026201595|nr:type III-B CRISPR-associated protein Cas10/Cmr2 [Rhodoferax sp.]MDD5333027.1 type III-B CRISPR-associated protein Cas10/Cmr2 [Rhodoferax sp.]